GFPNPTINIPPLSGPFMGKPGYIEVIVNYSQPRAFSRVFGASPTPITARAVATGRWEAPKMGILILDPTADGALTTNGGGAISVVGAPLIDDSAAFDAATATGGGTVYATEFDITGSPGVYGNGTFSGNILVGQPPTPDPLAYLPEPSTSGVTVQSNNNT